MKKKGLFFMYSLQGGGAERTVVNIINNLNKNDFNVTLVLGSKNNNEYLDLVSKDIKVVKLNCKKLRYCLFKLRNTIINENPDFLFTTINANNILLMLSKIISFKKIPTIIREASNRTQAGGVTRLNKVLTFILYNYCSNKVIALSKGVEEDLNNNFRIDNDKIEIIYNPVEVNQIRNLSQEPIDDINIEETEKSVLAVGRLVEQKDFKTLIRAFYIVQKSVKAKLIILGQGPKEEELKDLSKKLGIEKKIVFLGFKKNPYKYMGASDVFVLSSKWEGFGHVIVEAMASGTPVISTNCQSGPSEIIEENKYGILVPIENPKLLAGSIIETLINDEIREKYIEMGYKRIGNYQSGYIVNKYEEIFRNI